jgi:MATE family multidrug resistance protein
VPPITGRLLRLINLSIPAISSFALMVLQDQINFWFIGRLNDTNSLAAVGLGNMLVALTAYSLVIGMNTALETLVSQAYGRQNLRDCGLYLHRSILMIMILLLPLGIALPYTSGALQYFGVN